jgi:hypothetical protein
MKEKLELATSDNDNQTKIRLVAEQAMTANKSEIHMLKDSL